MRTQLKMPHWMKQQIREIVEAEGGTMTNYVLAAMRSFAHTAPELPDESDAAIHIRNSEAGREIIELADSAAIDRYGSARRARNRVVRSAVAEALRQYGR